MQSSKFIYSWLVLGPIYNEEDQVDEPKNSHSPWAAEIIWDIDKNDTFKPADLTESVEKAPKPGDTATYGIYSQNDCRGIYKRKDYRWRVLSFTDSTWENIHNIEDDIHRYLGPSDPRDPSLNFADKHHALVFFLVYIYSQYARDTQLCVRSDDSIRVWFNGPEIEPLRFPAGERDAVKKNPELGERDIGDGPPPQHPEETCANISLRQGYNILLAAVSETHVEWGFSARIEDAQCLKISPTPSGPCFDYRGDLPLR